MLESPQSEAKEAPQNPTCLCQTMGLIAALGGGKNGDGMRGWMEALRVIEEAERSPLEKGTMVVNQEHAC